MSPATKDEKLGMAWWNGLTARERRHILSQTETHVGKLNTSVAAAWELWKAGKITMSSASKNKAAQSLGRLGGKAKSPAKIAAARANGRKGGRPKKKQEQQESK